MLKIEELNKSKEIFDGTFSRVEIAIETKDYYNHQQNEYVTYVVVVNSRIDMIDRKVKATAKFMKGNIPEGFKIGYMYTEEKIVPQDIHEIIEQQLFAMDAESLFTDNDWFSTYRAWLIEAVEKNIRTVTLETGYGKFKQYKFQARSFQIL